MQRLMILLAIIAMQPSPPGAYAQELRTVVDRFAEPATASKAGPHAVEIPDSARQKVGYKQWKGGAIGGGLGVVTGLVLALAANGRCADCGSDDPNVGAITLVGAGLGGALGFLVGLASPKYEWVPSTAVRAAPRSPN